MDPSPSTDAGSLPTSGYRIPISSTQAFPAKIDGVRIASYPPQLGTPVCFDLDGSPVYIGSALLKDSVQPCKILAQMQMLHVPAPSPDIPVPLAHAPIPPPTDQILLIDILILRYASVPYGGTELLHTGRYELLSFLPMQMEWVKTSNGRVPEGKKAVDGGYEPSGHKLYHALGTVNDVRVPGKTGQHLGCANFPLLGKEHSLREDYEILCWR
ncbi:uncharacterized protein SCHCODRAFT_02626726 [Schizophyllum commune H4-8]|nr:uncharacterized protein SCHCODRAFT_02626726 [Schizophyllum commune H4-8]KAI5892647.1 hypothetical protein SCHCODRAFT_02626726 [Schizophyllum commune H4-8]